MAKKKHPLQQLEGELIQKVKVTKNDIFEDDDEGTEEIEFICKDGKKICFLIVDFENGHEIIQVEDAE
jgi:hypothetical protein